MPIPTSQFIPLPYFSPLATTNPPFMSVSLLLFCKQVHPYNFKNYIPYVSDVFFWLTSLIMIISRYIYVAENGIILFF